jgi:hypothetical protein
MDQTKIFIASSEKAQRLAEVIRDEVNLDDNCQAQTWKDALESCGAQSKIEALERWIGTYDFAVILFSAGDLWAKQAGMELKSRDDCIFEAGLFMATLGRQRCLLLSSVEIGALPSDLGGITYMKFVEPDDLMNYGKCRPPAQLAAGQIKARVQQIASDQSPGRRPLTRQDILKRERMESQGGMLPRIRWSPLMFSRQNSATERQSKFAKIWMKISVMFISSEGHMTRSPRKFRSCFN